jgi:hypothetical protein
MEITYTNSFGDILFSQFYVFKLSRVTRVAIVVLLIILIRLEFQIADIANRINQPLEIKIVTFFVITTALVLIFVTLISIGILIGSALIYGFYYLISSAGFGGRRSKLVASETGISISVKHKTDSYKWRGVSSIDQTDHLIIFMPTDWSVAAIPKRSFASPDKAEEFFLYLKEQQAQARKGSETPKLS